MKKILFIVSFLYTSILTAQKANVIVEGISPNLYLTHIVNPKENYYSIGRLYNQHPKAIASFNHTTLEKGLAIGQTLKIPLNTMNYDVSGANAGGETLVPVYHVVTKNETLFRIGNNHASPLDGLRKWNSLASDVIEVGTPLIVGHLKVKDEHLASFKAIPAQEIVVQITPASNTPAATLTLASEQPVVKAKTTKLEPIVEKAIPGTNAEEAAMEKPASQNAKVAEAQPVVAEAKKVEAEVKQKEVAPVVVPEVTERKPEPLTNAVEPVATQPVTSVGSLSGSAQGAVNDLTVPPTEDGVFGSVFVQEVEDKSLVNKAGEAGTFKSTSGWQDKKYYVLINDVQPGTIVKVSTLENKAIYAKVLGSLPETKESKNMLLRMSSAAASHLGIIDPKFPVQVSFYQ